MNFKVKIVLISCIFYNTAFAQQTLSLNDCIDYAIKNHSSIKNAELDYKSSKSKVGETRAIGLPQINGKWDVNNNINIQKQFIEARTFEPSAPEGLIIPIAFGLDYGTNMNITATQLIFDASYIMGLKAANTYTQLFEQSVNKTKTQLIEDVSKAYYLALITEERINQLEENEKLLTQLLEDTKILLTSGFSESLDVKRTTVNVNNLKVEIQKLKSLKNLTFNLLKFQIGMPQSETITLTDKLENFMSIAPTEKLSIEYSLNSDFQILEIQKTLNSINLQNEKLRFLPSLGAFYSTGINYGSNAFGDVFNFGNYMGYNMVGASLNVPIFSSGQRKYRVDQARIETQKIDNNIEFLKQSIDMQVAQYQSELADNLSVLKIRKENKELAEEVYSISKIKYEQGMTSNFEVLSAQTDLKTAQTDYYSALYDVLVAQIELNKVMGNSNINK